jgi:hypothetical protein
MMAIRPVFIPHEVGRFFVEALPVEFTWHAGMSASQKRKNIDALHLAFEKEYPGKKLLEISSYSREAAGVSLSAFNLPLELGEVRGTVETFFQGSKVFFTGGPYQELYLKTSLEAKKDPRLKEEGRLKVFLLFKEEWPLEPPTLFYDWLYLNALFQNEELATALLRYQGFTDIAFNPKKSLNCQARAAALFLSLYNRGKGSTALLGKEEFLDLLGNHKQNTLFS